MSVPHHFSGSSTVCRSIATLHGSVIIRHSASRRASLHPVDVFLSPLVSFWNGYQLFHWHRRGEEAVSPASNSTGALAAAYLFDFDLIVGSFLLVFLPTPLRLSILFLLPIPLLSFFLLFLVLLLLPLFAPLPLLPLLPLLPVNGRAGRRRPARARAVRKSRSFGGELFFPP